MSAVDVLAAWDRQIEWLRDLVATNPGSECHTEELKEAEEARDAMGELIELVEWEINGRLRNLHTPPLERWEAALARCKAVAP